MACPQVVGGGDSLQIWRLAANILNKQSCAAKTGWSPAWGVGHGANKLLTVKYKLVTECHKGPQNWIDYLDRQPKLKKMNIRSDMWHVRNLYREGSFMTVVKEILK
jgi:hypothetical protein